jgi:hypothetical protein
MEGNQCLFFNQCSNETQLFLSDLNYVFCKNSQFFYIDKDNSKLKIFFKW